MNIPRPKKYPLETMLEMLSEPNRSACLRLLAENHDRFQAAPGSSHNHQTWPGGYLDHVAEDMNFAIVYYGALLSTGRMIPFSLQSALLVLFLHDLEKPWKYVDGVQFHTKAARRDFRENEIREYGITLTPEEENAFRYTEGEMNDYRPTYRVMNELAAFCHICDVTSARIYHDHPLKDQDPWKHQK